MFTATRVAALVIVFALGATSALVLAPRAETDPDVIPAAEAHTLDDVARFSWHGWVSKEGPASGTVRRTGYGEAVEGATVEFDIDATDERLSGAAAHEGLTAALTSINGKSGASSSRANRQQPRSRTEAIARRPIGSGGRSLMSREGFRLPLRHTIQRRSDHAVRCEWWGWILNS